MTRASDTAKLLGAGATILDGTTISTADNDPQLILTSTDADGDRGPVVQFTRDSGSPADNDVLGRVQFLFDNDAAEVTTAVQIEATATDVSNGTEDSALNLVTMVDGNTRGRLKFTSSEAVFNEDSIDSDFRVESDASSYGLFLDGGSGHVGVHAQPTTTSSVYKGIQTGLGGTLLGRSDDTPLYLSSNVTYTDNWKYLANTTGSQIALGTNIQFYTIASGTAGNTATRVERMRLTSDSSLLLNKTADDIGTAGVNLAADGGFSAFTRSNDPVLYVRRNTSDGVIVNFMQDDGTEGSISVSGSTVSYNSFSGSHWSRLTDNSKPTILKGTIIETIDEMCDWYRVKFTIAETEDIPERIEEV